MRRIPVIAVLIAGIAGAGCGSDDPPPTPVACLGPARAYLTALERAPGAVRLEGTTAISDCLITEQQPGAQAQVGEAIVAAATELNRDARRDPGGEATVRLGYLVGAAQEAAAATAGIHADLILRIDAAARYAGERSGELSARFERAFGAGYAAGQATG